MPPKAGCTTWQRFYLALINDDGNYINHTTNEKLASFPSEIEFKAFKKSPYTSNAVFKTTPRMLSGPVMDRIYHDKNWIKVINVRHPFERLYSGWKDKFNRTGAHDAWIFKKKYEDIILGYKMVDKKDISPFFLFLVMIFILTENNLSQIIENY